MIEIDCGSDRRTQNGMSFLSFLDEFIDQVFEVFLFAAELLRFT
jgi:hypothetical protein